jgi:peroxiredoxin
MTRSPTTTDGPRPSVGQPLPAFSLPDASGGITLLLDYRQRQPVLVVFLHDTACADCSGWLAALARRRAGRDELRVAALVVASASVAELRGLALELDLPFPLLSDEEGSVARRYSLTIGDQHGVAVFAANRYGHLLEVWRADEASGLPAPDAALDRIAFAEMEDCGCGLPAWSPDVMAGE